MKNIIKLLGIIAFVAVIGFSFVACDNGGDDGGVLPAPNLTGWYNASLQQIELSWTEIDGAVGYNVYVSLIGSADLAQSTPTRVSDNSAHQGVNQPGIYVYYQVAAVDRNGNEGKRSNICPVQTVGQSINTSLNGVWVDNTWVMTISGSSATLNSWNPTSALSIDAKNKGYFPNGGQVFRNIVSTGNLTWSGQRKGITDNSSRPDVATGTDWGDVIITMNPNGRTITVTYTAGWTYASGNTDTFTRQ